MYHDLGELPLRHFATVTPMYDYYLPNLGKYHLQLLQKFSQKKSQFLHMLLVV
jgi:hypothetical protein